MFSPRPAVFEEDIAKIPLGLDAKDGYAIVDKEFGYLADRFKFWAKKSKGRIYAFTSTEGKNTPLHHLVLPRIQGKDTDHIDRDPLNNRLSNLRRISHRMNVMNRGVSSNNKCGYKGVSLKRTSSDGKERWRAQIYVHGRAISGGSLFDTPEEAAICYNQMATEHYGNFAYLNKVDGK